VNPEDRTRAKVNASPTGCTRAWATYPRSNSRRKLLRSRTMWVDRLSGRRAVDAAHQMDVDLIPLDLPAAGG